MHAIVIPDRLKVHMRARGIDTVLVTGCVTNAYCESTAWNAMMRNFRAVVITDANAARSGSAHSPSLQNFYISFGDVMTAGEAQGYLVANAGGNAATA